MKIWSLLLIFAWGSLSFGVSFDELISLREQLEILHDLQPESSLTFSGISFPFIRNIDQEKEAQLAIAYAQSVQKNIDDEVSRAAKKTIATPIQIDFAPLLEKLNTEIEKLPIKTQAYKKELRTFLDGFKDVFFNDPQTLSDLQFKSMLVDYNSKAGEVIKKGIPTSDGKAVITFNTIIKPLFEQFVRKLNDITRNQKRLAAAIQTVPEIRELRAQFIKKESKKEYQETLQKLLKEYVLSKYDTTNDARQYLQLIKFNELINVNKDGIQELLKQILAIRTLPIQQLQKLYHAYEDINEKLSQKPELKARLINISKTIEELKPRTQTKILGLPSDIISGWDSIKKEWAELKNYPSLTSGSAQVQKRIDEQMEIVNKSQDWLNLLFTLYLNPNVLESGKGNERFSINTKKSALSIVKDYLKAYKDDLDEVRKLGGTPQDLSNIYEMWQKALEKVEAANNQALVFPHYTLLDIERGGDTEEARWDEPGMNIIKALNQLIIEKFDINTQKFSPETKSIFEKVYQKYLDFVPQRIKTEYDDAYKSWKIKVQQA